MPSQELRLAIVTGAASGLGRAFCRRLAMAGGWHVTAADVDQAALDQTLAELRAEFPGASLAAERMDVANIDNWRDLRERHERDWPRLHLLVNNAGVCMAAEVGEGSIDDWQKVMGVNFHGVLNGCQTMTPWLRQSAVDRPAVINVASIFGLVAAPSMGAYAASKAAVVALSEAMYAELRPHGVRVTIVAPGFFRTQLLDRGRFKSRRQLEQAEELTRTSKFTADQVAAAALAGSARGQFYVVLGRRARWFWRWKRSAPVSLLRALAWRYRRMMDGAEIAEAEINASVID